MSKRGENIHKRKDGRWEARIFLQSDNKYHSFYAKSYGEVKAKIRNISDTPTTKANKSPVTVSTICSEWLEDIEIRTKQSTTAKYTHTVNRHIIPDLGFLKPSELTTFKINHFIKSKTDLGLSSKTIRDILSVLKQILKFAQLQGHIQNADYNFSKPKIQTKEASTLTQNQQKLLVSYVKNNITTEYLGILLSLYMGLRLGELCALQWKDIDLETATISVNKTLQRIQNTDINAPYKTKIIIDTPKSLKSVRDIPIPNFIYEILYRMSKLRQSDEYVLTGTKHYIEPRNYQYKFKKLIKQAGLPDINFHALRHTFATRAVEKEMDIKSLSEVLGHSTVNFTLNRYVHSSAELKKTGMEKLIACY